MSVQRRLPDQILEDMRMLDPGDPESSHAKADQLLQEALLSLALYCDERHPPGPEPRILRAQQIIDAYRSVPKWYA